MSKTPMSTVTLTNSELNTLRACAWKHHIKYELGLEPVDQQRSSALNIGTLVHAGVAEVYMTIQRMQLVGLRPTQAQLRAVVEATMKAEKEKQTAEFEDLFDSGEQESAIESDLHEATQCLDLFVEHIALPNFDRYDVLGVEVAFKIPLLTATGRRSGDELEGVMDLVLRDRSINVILPGEHKTTVNDAHGYETQLSHDPQLPIYLFGLRSVFGDSVTGQVLLNVMRKSYPREPTINKDGTVSVAGVDTTREIYAAALERQEDPAWFTKASAERDDVDPEDEKKTLKAMEKLAKAEERLTVLQEKQQARLEALPGIERFVSQFEEIVSGSLIDRGAHDAWNGARLIRLFRRGQLTPWRNGTACRHFGRLCGYHSACTDNVIEPGDLLQRREGGRHSEVTNALATGQTMEDVVRVLETLDTMRLRAAAK